MAFWLGLVACGVLCGATPLDDYLNKLDSNYKWRDTGATVKNNIFGSTAHILNVTSQQWLDETKAIGPNGALWTHQVAVVIPKNLRHTNVSMAVLTGGCNEHPSPPDNKDEYLVLADDLAHTSGAIAIVVYQLPNCHILYPADPLQKHRSEDAMIAFAWYQFLNEPDHDPEWLPRLPMAKAAFACMQATQEYLAETKVANVEGWVVSGASKRGWTTWDVGMANCTRCPKVLGIAPLVPIAPSIVADVHRQWQSYGGFTFAFADYTALNLTTQLDSPVFKQAQQIMDPIYNLDMLAKIPKVVVVSSDDEFMQFDWTNIWWDQMTGEKRLLITPNSEHSLATGIPEVVTCLTAVFLSIVEQKPMPDFSYAIDETTGELTVTLPPGLAHGKVVLRHAETISHTRRDFRWVRLASNDTGVCTAPEIPLKQPLFGGNCLQPIFWLGKTLAAEPGTPNVFKATPPEPKKGHWTGYYIEVFFPSNSETKDDFQFTSPGFVWPNTLPFADCHAETCIGRLV